MIALFLSTALTWKLLNLVPIFYRVGHPAGSPQSLRVQAFVMKLVFQL